MKKIFIPIFYFLCLMPAWLYGQKYSAIVGNDTASFSGDDDTDRLGRSLELI